MSKKSSNSTYPSIYPSLSHKEDLINLTSANTMTSPGNTPVYSQSGPMGNQSKLTSQTIQMQPPSHEQLHHSPPTVAIGNPGAGKSTILNSLAGQLLFGSGISIGCGFTKQLDAKEANGQTFIDTPGVEDETYKKTAAEALTEVFNQGGHMKILFFVTQDAGKIVAQDATTMKMILEQVPEIRQNYGIIVNKIPRNTLAEMKKNENFMELLLRLKNKNTLLLPMNSKLQDKANALVPPSEIHQDLANFINTTVPEAYITPGLITEIDLDDFEQLSQQVENLKSELKNQERQKANTIKLLSQYENEEQQKRKRHESALQIKGEEVQTLKKKIRDKEEEIRGYQQKSEKEIRDLRQRSENEMRQLEQREHEINDKKDQISKKEKAAKQRKAMMNRSQEWDLCALFGTDFGLQNA